MEGMGSRSATELLLLPVRLHGIRLGRPIDLLLDPEAWRVLGYVVLCGDESRRFLAFAAADPWEDAINVRSALCCSRTWSSTETGHDPSGRSSVEAS